MVPTGVRMFAPAKINLILAVLGLREDGYHELATIMHQISLIDVVHLKLVDRPGIWLHTTHPQLADDESNLAYRAARVFLEESGEEKGVAVLVEKSIPLGAGLAGGSTDAAAVLAGLNQLCGYPLSPQRLLELAATLGSDVPFCLLGGTALARGRGEILSPLAVQGTPHFVLAKPPLSVSTAAIYREWDRQGRVSRPEFEKMVAALAVGDWDLVAGLTCNSLQAITISLFPQVALLQERMLELGARGALMSGSGPTVFGIFSTSEEAERAFASLKKDYAECYQVTSYIRNEFIDCGGEEIWKKD